MHLFQVRNAFTRAEFAVAEQTIGLDFSPSRCCCGGGGWSDADRLQYKFLAVGAVQLLASLLLHVAQYASEDGKGKAAFEDVDQCLRALEELDSLLLHASRNDPQASVKLMKAQIGLALNALDSLLRTVPAEMLDKGKVIADAYCAPEDDTQLDGDLDPELKQLESIL
ncbi:hypothetical protein AKJ16_DCAP20741 [Drosera capensis]